MSQFSYSISFDVDIRRRSADISSRGKTFGVKIRGRRRYSVVAANNPIDITCSRDSSVTTDSYVRTNRRVNNGDVKHAPLFI